MSNPQIQVDTEVALDAELSNKHFCLDDPEQRQHYTNGPHPDRDRSAAGVRLQMVWDNLSCLGTEALARLG